ncbi:MAG TPA: hypothetical protein VFR93_08270, partial [Candidatus Limnocylindrales bacterium]|nr:hypothetical protein [Candidatus Limnocylindrales bacterium]
WLAATVAEVVVDRVLALGLAPASAFLTLASDSATVGLLALWTVLAATLVERRDQSLVAAPASSPATPSASRVVDRAGMHDP